MIDAGDAEIVVAGGMESMTQAPYLLPGARAGYRLGDATLVDSMMYDGLTCAFDQCAMGLATERYNGADGVSRERQDAFSALSHERAAAAIKDGRFADEIVPVEVPQRKGDPLVVDTDEGVRPETTAESLGALRPAFDTDGTITAGNASQISDGGAAVIVMSRAKADELGVTPLGELVSYGQVAGPEPLAAQPAVARHLGGARARPASPIGDIDLFEINEAFAAVGLASADDLGIDERHRSTSTAARSPSVTRSGCRAPASRSPRSSSSSAGAAVPRRSASAAAAARATRRCSARSDPNEGQ